MQNTPVVPCPQAGTVDCEPELRVSQVNLYDLRNKKKPGNFIQAEITAMGYFKYYVVNLPKNKRGCPGTWLFEVSWEYFIQQGITSKGIRGDWTFGDNWETVNRLTANNKMTVEEASQQTWAFQRAQSKGYQTVVVLDADGSPGNYRSVDVLFLP